MSPGVSLSLCPRAHPSSPQPVSPAPLAVAPQSSWFLFQLLLGRAPAWLGGELWGAGWLRAELREADLV